MFESRSRHAFVAQLEEQLPGTQQAACSIHAEGTSLRRFAASAGKPVAQDTWPRVTTPKVGP